MWPNRETERHAVIGVLPRDGVAWLSVSLHHFMHTWYYLVAISILKIIIIYKTIFIVLSSTVQSHMREFNLGLL